MAKIFLICGKICSGKTTCAKVLKEKYGAVILSTDEATYDLIDNVQGEFYNEFAARVNSYLAKKAAEICLAGASVILDWGFWTKENREAISRYFSGRRVPYEWHYTDISDEAWKRNIASRNEAVKSGRGGCDFYVDEGLMQKLLGLFEAPQPSEIDVWHRTD